MLDWLFDRPGVLGAGLLAIVIALAIRIARDEDAYKAQLLARAHTYADTLAVERIMAERATANAISFGAGLVAGAAAARR